MSYVKSLILLAVLVVIAVGLFIFSGIYNVGADAPHWAMTARLIEHLRDQSIERYASGIVVPDLEDPKLIAEGAEHYGAMCTGCHLAPGMRGSELRAGLYPLAPNFAEYHTLDSAKAFWVIKHGVKLTAMPAWGKTHDDDAIWGLVAFIKKLPDLSPEQYQKLAGETPTGAHMHKHSHGDHAHGEHEYEGTQHNGGDSINR